MKKSVHASDAPKVVGPYTQAIVSGDTIYCSGQIAIDPKSGIIVTTSIEGQTEQVIKNLKSVLKEAGATLNDVVMSHCFLSNMNDYQKFNEVYEKYFENSKPARFTVGVSDLPANALVEIAVIATIDN